MRVKSDCDKELVAMGKLAGGIAVSRSFLQAVRPRCLGPTDAATRT